MECHMDATEDTRIAPSSAARRHEFSVLEPIVHREQPQPRTGVQHHQGEHRVLGQAVRAEPQIATARS